jgi:hypothetical protein
MSNPAVIPEAAKEHFWTVVRECLVAFHGKSRNASRANVLRFRKKVEEYPKEAMELFYHHEPFDIACRIAKHPLSVDKHLKRYIHIRDVETPG